MLRIEMTRKEGNIVSHFFFFQTRIKDRVADFFINSIGTFVWLSTPLAKNDV